MPGHDLQKTSAEKSSYVEGRAGWRVFFLLLAVALAVGISIRLVFNPTRIKQWAVMLLTEQGASAGITFQTVSLDFAREAFPQLALDLTGVEATPAGECHLEPSVKIAKLRVPLDFLALFSGRIGVGVVAADDVTVDLDALKVRCPQAQASISRGVESRPSPASNRRAAARGLASEPPRPWWRPEQLHEIRGRVRGFKFSHVELQFEGKTKKVYLDSVLIRPGSDDDSFHLTTDLRIPPELAYDEQLPIFRIDANAHPTYAEVTVKAGISEGDLQAQGALRPAEDNQLEIDLKASVENVPLSTLAPVITKSGLVKTAFKPRFLWMGCQASIHGIFQGLFNHNPLTLEKCQIVGDRSSIHFEKAVRQADGTWEPFSVEMENFDMAGILETFGAKTFAGTFGNYGRLSGKGELLSKNSARFAGVLSGAQVRFSNRGETDFQKVGSADVKATWQGDRVDMQVEKIALDGGDFTGMIVASYDLTSSRASLHASIERLRFQDSVGQLLFKAAVANVSGQADVQYEKQKVKGGGLALKLSDVVGKDFDLKELTVHSEFDESREEFSLDLRAPEIQLAQSSWLFTALKPIFFTHEFAQHPVALRDTVVRARFLNPDGIQWDSLRSSLEGRKIHLSSAGSISRDRKIDAWVGLDYPSVKHLKWQIHGVAGADLQLSDDGKFLADLRKRSVVDDRVLGLPVSVSGSASGSASGTVSGTVSGRTTSDNVGGAGPSITEKTGRGLKEFGEKVIRKARRIIPVVTGQDVSDEKPDSPPSSATDNIPTPQSAN